MAIDANMLPVSNRIAHLIDLEWRLERMTSFVRLRAGRVSPFFIREGCMCGASNIYVSIPK